MSKRLGNVVEPMAVIEETGADALRWYFCVNNPEQPSRFSARAGARGGAELPAAAVERAVVLHHLRQPRRLAARRARSRRSPSGRRSTAGSCCGSTTWSRDVTAALDGYAIADAARAIEAFVDDLTNWYIRRSRDRFWARPAGERHGADKESAYQTLYEVLTTLARLLAPFTPFVADVLHRNLVRSQSTRRRGERPPRGLAGSRLRGREDEAALEQSMAAGAAHRALRPRGAQRARPQDAPAARRASPWWPRTGRCAGLVEPYLDLVRDELNVKEIRWAERRAEFVHHEVRPIFPMLGKRFGKRMPAVKAALDAADGDALARASSKRRGAIAIELDGERVDARARRGRGAADRERRHGHRRRPRAAGRARHRAHAGAGRRGPARARSSTASRRRARTRDLDYADRIRVRYRAAPSSSAAIDAPPRLDRRRDAGGRARRRATNGSAAAFEAGEPSRRLRHSSSRSRGCDMAGIFKAYDVRGIYPDRARRDDRAQGSASPSGTCSTTSDRAQRQDRRGGARHAPARACRSSARWSRACSPPASTSSTSASPPRR